MIKHILTEDQNIIYGFVFWKYELFEHGGCPRCISIVQSANQPLFLYNLMLKAQGRITQGPCLLCLDFYYSLIERLNSGFPNVIRSVNLKQESSQFMGLCFICRWIQAATAATLSSI
jgi:hypothetical protein